MVKVCSRLSRAVIQYKHAHSQYHMAVDELCHRQGPCNWSAYGRHGGQRRGYTLFLDLTYLGMIGPSMMRASDAPRYRIGFTAAITLTCLCTVTAICSSMGYLWWNRKRRTQGLLNEAHSTAVWVAEVEGEIEEKEVRKRFVYTW